jgi:hypothetical protein
MHKTKEIKCQILQSAYVIKHIYILHAVSYNFVYMSQHFWDNGQARLDDEDEA